MTLKRCSEMAMERRFAAITGARRMAARLGPIAAALTAILAAPPGCSSPGPETPRPGMFMRTPEGELLPVPASLEDQVQTIQPRYHAVDLDGDGSREIIVEWVEREEDPLHCYRIYRQGGHGTVRRLSEFKLGGMMAGGLTFLREPGPTRPWKAIIVIQEGAAWGSYYAVRPDGTGADGVAGGVDCEYRDLDGDGTHEWIVSHKHNDLGHLRWSANAKCIEVHRWVDATERYRREWPPAEPALLEIGALVFDIDRDGTSEIVALMATGKGPRDAWRLCVYEIRPAGVELTAEIGIERSKVSPDILSPRELDGRMRIPLRLPGDDEKEYEYDRGSLTIPGERD